MPSAELNVVTGAYSFTGKYIARRLLALGRRVSTLTGHPHREHPFGDRVRAFPFNFEDPPALAASLAGATTLYNTYWIRFEHGATTFERTLARTEALLQAARQAGVGRIVHISIINADQDSPYPYFRAKGRAEQLVREAGLPCTILRPTVLFGSEGILFNNIAWLLRKLPVFALPGAGDYRLQPVHVDDVARLAVQARPQQSGPTIDVAGPEILTFRALVELIAEAIGSRPRLLRVRPQRAVQLSGLLGGLVSDTLLTRDEIAGLMDNLLVSSAPPLGRTLFSSWLQQHADSLGRTYFSELERHFRQT
jgi:NADH dehydrogenase